MIELSFNTVWIPVAITLFAIVYPIITAPQTEFGGIDAIFKFIITLPIALISWIVYGIFK